MFWSTVKFDALTINLQPTFLRKPIHIAFLKALNSSLSKIYAETLYRMQHDGRTIYLEKVLNEWFEVVGYDTQNHETTKLVYIEDVAEPESVFVHLDEEDETVFIEDDEDDSEDDLFIDAEFENDVAFSFIIFIPDTFTYNEYEVRALVDSYRYFGKKYTIQTYTI